VVRGARLLAILLLVGGASSEMDTFESEGSSISARRCVKVLSKAVYIKVKSFRSCNKRQSPRELTPASGIELVIWLTDPLS
jgi:hypothetical protein